MDTMTKLAADFLTTIAFIQPGKEDKGSMIVKLPRLLCEKIGAMANRGMNDDRSLVNVGIATFNDTMGREKDGNGTYGYCKGFTQEKLVDWMNRFIRFVKENAGDRLLKLRSLRENVIFPEFKGEVIYQKVEFFKNRAATAAAKKPGELKGNTKDSNGDTP
jgi:hypothetical protein